MSNLPEDPFVDIAATGTPNADLPAGEFPSMARINVTDLVGPDPTNRQHKALEKRDESLRTKVNKLIAFANAVDLFMLRRDGTEPKDGNDGVRGNIAMNTFKWTGMGDGTDPQDGATFGQLTDVSDTLTNLLALLQAEVDSISGLTPGLVQAFIGIVVPVGYLEAQGQVLNYVDYPDLAPVLAATWGGDGITTFGLPDLRGRTLIGRGQGSGLTNRTFATYLGEESHILTVPEIPAHTHTYDRTESGGSGIDSPGSRGPFSRNTGSTGGGGSHNNMQPSAAIKWIVKT